MRKIEPDAAKEVAEWQGGQRLDKSLLYVFKHVVSVYHHNLNNFQSLSPETPETF